MTFRYFNYFEKESIINSSSARQKLKKIAHVLTSVAAVERHLVSSFNAYRRMQSLRYRAVSCEIKDSIIIIGKAIYTWDSTYKKT